MKRQSGSRICLLCLCLLFLESYSFADSPGQGEYIGNGDIYTMNLRLDGSELSGELEIDYVNTAPVPLDAIVFRLDDNLGRLSSIEIKTVTNTSETLLDWSYVPFEFGKWQSEKAQLRVTLTQPLVPRASRKLRIEFKSQKPKALNPKMMTLQDDPYLSFDAWYPKAMSWIDGQWSVNDDRPADYHVHMELPAKYVLASTGKTIVKSLNDTRQTVTLHAARVRGFSIYGHTKWHAYSRQTDRVHLHLVIPAVEDTWPERILDEVVQVIGFYESMYGPYPQTKLEVVCIGSMDGRAHGSSTATNVIVLWLSKQFEQQYRQLIAHEIAHQYLGCLVGQDRREIGWGTVGLGMMMDREYARHYGINYQLFKKTFSWFYLEAERRGFNTCLSQNVEDLLRSEPPWSSGWNMSLQHGKALYVMLMLEDLIGRNALNGGIKALCQLYQGQCLSQADFLAYWDKKAGMSLDWFWQDWVLGHETADYALGPVRQGDGGWQVTVEQLGQATFPVAVEAECVSGLKLQKRINPHEKENVLMFETSEALKRITIDPNGICPETCLNNNSRSWPR